MRKEWLLDRRRGGVALRPVPPRPRNSRRHSSRTTARWWKSVASSLNMNPITPNNMQDYKVNGDTYRIVKDPQNFSQTGLAAWYGEEANGNTTALGEQFDPNGLTAAHPTLPIPSYVRVTNLANGRQLVVRVNDRGPYTKGPHHRSVESRRRSPSTCPTTPRSKSISSTWRRTAR